MPKIRIQAFVEVRDPKTMKVVARSKSKPNNLILNNFGKFLAALIQAPGTTERTITITDKDGNSRTVRVISDGYLFNHTSLGSIGAKLQVGSGSTSPARGNTAIETPFATAPENATFDSGTGSYAAGAISFSGSITAGGSGTIREVGFFFQWYAYGAPNKIFMMFHDLVSPGVSFTASQIIGVSYSVTL